MSEQTPVIPAMQSVAEANGFKLVSQCSCGGTHVMKYQKRVKTERFALHIRPKVNTWTLDTGANLNTRLATGKADTLTEKLTKYGVIQTV